ncbi:hypothetical protein AU467_25695 [Mesorhizobium loti]|uniref:Uncharacterized protein n=1 Tax=Rhizobium loti TaxID=381 RepID=A0A101KRC7_RHILI|nr:hypothetical protein AU467_25695 [Mesorhizobium loti]
MLKPLILFCFASLFGATGIAFAEDAPPDATSQRLDRIEHKLDAILRRLEASDKEASEDAGAADPDNHPVEEEKAAQAQAAARTDASSYKRGIVAIARIAPEKPDALSDIPADSSAAMSMPAASFR